MVLNKDYWEQRYITTQTQWDLGEVSPPLKSYFETLTDTSQRLLIPGAGNAYEASFLWNKGFKNLSIVDIAKPPLDNFTERHPNVPTSQVIHEDFFELNGTFDTIIEHTFFCALDPKKRKDYVLKMHQLLKHKGRLIGLLFNFELSKNGPPFGGSISEYEKLFSSLFDIIYLSPAEDSIASRKGKELFFIFEKK